MNFYKNGNLEPGRTCSVQRCLFYKKNCHHIGFPPATDLFETLALEIAKLWSSPNFKRTSKKLSSYQSCSLRSRRIKGRGWRRGKRIRGKTEER